MPRRRFRNLFSRRPYAWVLAAFVIGYAAMAVTYVLAMATIQASTESLLRPADLIIPRTNDVFIFTFFIVTGASVGSFLNVVAWRMPLGKSINGHSYCPRCRVMLLPRDNVPIAGWFLIGGRCRTCRLPISKRYPIVEVCVALTFAGVGVAEVYRFALPYQIFHAHAGPLWTPPLDAATLIALAYHLFAITILWAMGLIRLDGIGDDGARRPGHRIPMRLIAVAAMVLILGMIALPFLCVVPPWLSVPERWPPVAFWADPVKIEMSASEAAAMAAARVLTGLAVAGFLARVLAKGVSPTADLKRDPLGGGSVRLVDLVAMLSVVGITVGWQATLGVTLIASGLAVALGRLLTRPNDALGRLGLALPVAMALQIVLWETLIASGWWPSEWAPPWLIGLAFVSNLCVPIWLRDRPEAKKTQELGTNEMAIAFEQDGSDAAGEGGDRLN